VSSLPPALLGALVTILGAPLTVAGQPILPQQEAGLRAVEVTVGAIIANNSQEWLDHRVTAMNPGFRKLFPYSSFRLLNEERQAVPWGAPVRLDLSGKRYVLVVPREIKNQRVLMRVRLIDGSRSLLDTTVSLRDRGTLLVGGPTETDGVLILTIGAATIR
jgi:hypothetical protein